MIVRVPALAGLGWCELEDIQPPCDPYKTQEFGCVCADAQGNLIDRSGAVVDIYAAPATPAFGLPGMDQKTLGLVLGGALVLFMVLRR
jgi:hypothetical protein